MPLALSVLPSPEPEPGVKQARSCGPVPDSRISSLSALPALKPTVLLAGMRMVSPVCGFRPSRASRLRMLKVPKPIRVTSSPREAAADTWSVNAVITSLAFSRVSPVRSAMAAASSGLRIGYSFYCISAGSVCTGRNHNDSRLLQSIAARGPLCKPRGGIGVCKLASFAASVA